MDDADLNGEKCMKELKVSILTILTISGPPDPPRNCTLSNQTQDSLQVDCVAGFSSGLKQEFHMEVFSLPEHQVSIFNDILLEAFLYESVLCSFSLHTVCVCKFLAKGNLSKVSLKMLVTLHTGETFI